MIREAEDGHKIAIQLTPVACIYLAMPIKPKRSSERLRRRKDSLLKKAYEMAKFCEVDVALILRIRATGRYITYKSVDLESWPPSKEEIVSTHYLQKAPGANR